MPAAAALIAGVSLLTFGVLLNGLQDQRDTAAALRGTTDALNAARELQRLALTMESEARGHQLTRSEGCLRAALAAGGGVSRDDIAVLVAQVGFGHDGQPGRRRLDRRENCGGRIFDTGTMMRWAPRRRLRIDAV